MTDTTVDEYAELKRRLSDREYRLDNLYSIVDEAGVKVPFVRNEVQKAYWSALWYCNLILKARQLGFSTFICILLLDMCLFNKNTTTGIIDYTLDDAKKKLDKIKFAYNNLPVLITKQVRLVKANEDEVVFSNGSRIEVGTSHVGTTLQCLHVSEFGRIAAETPDKAREIQRGAFGTVHAGQVIHVESTARGTGGRFYEMVQRAEAIQKEGRRLSEIDFRLHFFPWWKHKGYRLNPNAVIQTAEDLEYFEELQGKYGIFLDLFQRSWYAAQKVRVGFDDIKSEYPSTPEECFQTSIEGAYFKRELTKARAEGRIGLALPHDPTRLVNTMWDIGVDDTTSILFHQTDGLRHRFIDHYENSGEGIQHYATILKKKAEARGFNYGIHYAPNDIEVREWGSNAEPRIEIAKKLGIKFEPVPAVEDKMDAIEAARRMLGLSWFDVLHCSRAVECLDNYRKEWNELLGTWRTTPRHDWASHTADALMTGVLGIAPDHSPELRDRHRGKPRRQPSHWAS
jgi:hypothetical protein